MAPDIPEACSKSKGRAEATGAGAQTGGSRAASGCIRAWEMQWGTDPLSTRGPSTAEQATAWVGARSVGAPRVQVASPGQACRLLVRGQWEHRAEWG